MARAANAERWAAAGRPTVYVVSVVGVCWRPRGGARGARCPAEAESCKILGSRRDLLHEARATGDSCQACEIKTPQALAAVPLAQLPISGSLRGRAAACAASYVPVATPSCSAILSCLAGADLAPGSQALFGATLCRHEVGEVGTKAALKDKAHVGILFGAAWSGSCKQFMAPLVQVNLAQETRLDSEPDMRCGVERQLSDISGLRAPSMGKTRYFISTMLQWFVFVY